MTFLKPIFFTLALFMSLHSYGKVIQILHTNDLHSYFQGTRDGIGGYAQLKKVIDELKASAALQGIPTLYLDAGDFGEGSSFYFSNQGVDSLKALDILGVDVTVLGNHDFILGGKELRNQMKKANMQATLLSANLKGKYWMGLNKMVKDYKDFTYDDIKLRVFGLTTNEIHFMYPLRPLGYVAKPHKVGIKQTEKAQKEGVDFTIALTHIGLDHDIKLVENTRTLDMVVGGHTHIKLSRPQLTKNMEGKLIPIVHAGAHSGYVGSMIVDLQKDGQSQMIDYKMIDIFKDMEQDTEMKAFVDSAYQNRAEYFGRNWDEVIGMTDIPLTGNTNGQDGEKNSCWSTHMARLTRQIAKTDLGLQFDVFQGEQINPGLVTFGDLVDNFPHFRKWGDNGWGVSRAKVNGFLLKKILNMLAKSEVALQVTIDGLKVQDKSGKIRNFNSKTDSIENAFLNGDKIQSMRYYTIALPSEVPFGMLKLMNVMGYVLLHNLREVRDADYWTLLEDYIRKNSPIQCLED